jgi:PRC-barrel domain
MRSVHPTVMAGVAVLALTVAVGVALSADAPAPPPSLAPAPTTPAPATPEPSPPAAVTAVLNTREVEGILGREVRSTANENMGRIVDVLVDRSGQVRAAIIDFGGFLGVGSRKIAVDWAALHFTPGKPEPPITLDLNRDQVNAAPAYEDGKPVVVLGPLGKLEPLPF